jgi:hypothetical protein
VQDGRILMEPINWPVLYELKKHPDRIQSRARSCDRSRLALEARERHVCEAHPGRRGFVRMTDCLRCDHCGWSAMLKRPHLHRSLPVDRQRGGGPASPFPARPMAEAASKHRLLKRLRHALHCGMFAVLHLDPVFRPAAGIRPVAALEASGICRGDEGPPETLI